MPEKLSPVKESDAQPTYNEDGERVTFGPAAAITHVDENQRPDPAPEKPAPAIKQD